MVLSFVLVTACTRGDEAAISSPSTTATTATAATVSTTTAAPPTTVAGPDPCAASALAIEAGEGRAALGHGLSVYELRNTSSEACRMSGYPTVTVVDAQGRVLAEAQRGPGRILPDRPPASVVVAPGARAYVGVESPNVCGDGVRPAAADAVRVTPPGTTGAPLTAVATIAVCPGQAVLVSPVRATEADLTR
ncbi:MAG: DUF4232 domain-containing protein [Acidimicrobiales bacterium]